MSLPLNCQSSPWSVEWVAQFIAFLGRWAAIIGGKSWKGKTHTNEPQHTINRSCTKVPKSYSAQAMWPGCILRPELFSAAFDASPASESPSLEVVLSCQMPVMHRAYSLWLHSALPKAQTGKQHQNHEICNWQITTEFRLSLSVIPSSLPVFGCITSWIALRYSLYLFVNITRPDVCLPACLWLFENPCLHGDHYALKKMQCTADLRENLADCLFYPQQKLKPILSCDRTPRVIL